MNAIHYSLWFYFVRYGDLERRVVKKTFTPIPKYLFTKKYKIKYYERLSQEREKETYFFNNKKTGFHISNASRVFAYAYSGYSLFFSFILVVIAESVANLNTLVEFLLLATPIGVCYIPIYQAIFKKDRYLKYFKLFDKKDEHWHKKWGWITFVFCILSVATALFGLYIGNIISLLFIRFK